MDTTQDISKLIEWIHGQDYEINLRGRKNEVAFDLQLININWRTTGHKQLFTILHECGHIIERKDPVYFMTKFPGLLQSYINPAKGSTIYCTVDVIREEFHAWENGLKLSQELGIDVNKGLYWKFANDCLMSYFRWGVIKHVKTKPINEIQRKN